MDEIRIVRLRPDDDRARFEACGSIHEAEIPEGFLVRIGARFLTALYRHLSGSRHTFLFAALQGETVLGFIVGSKNTRRLYREFLFRNPFTLLPVAFSPSVLRRVYETWRYPSKKLEIELPLCEILNFCVVSDSQGKGVGSRLFSALCGEFLKQEVSEIRIVTGGGQESAHTFYEAKGAKLAGEIIVHEGETSRAYVYRLSEGE